MNLTDLHNSDTGVHTHVIFSPREKLISLQILKDHQLKEHITTVPALLICVQGHVIFENERGESMTLHPADYVNIEPNVKHWVNGIEDSQLLLMK